MQARRNVFKVGPDIVIRKYPLRGYFLDLSRENLKTWSGLFRTSVYVPPAMKVNLDILGEPGV